ncbi:MAG: polysaccharide deacetylase family protein, partial [Ignavibacteria bacterium]
QLFGIKMKELDMVGFSIEEKDANIWNGTIKEKSVEDEWILVPAEIISDKVKILAEWVRDDERIPAIVENIFGKGKAILLTSTYLLHPSNYGGVSSIEHIENFYDYIINSSNGNKKSKFELCPWPKGYSSAFCVTFNSEGNEDQTKKIQNFLKAENIRATFFIDSTLSAEQLSTLEKDESITLQSNLYTRADLSTLGFSQMIREILMNEQHFGKNFTGIRFPLGKTNFWGLLYADQQGYKYDTSIGVDHLTNYEGSVIPYNIPISQNGFYKTLNILEISPSSNDDEIYFGKSVTEPDYNIDVQKTDANLFEKYLFDFYDFAVKKYNGLMLYTGHPQYTGFSEVTLQPLKKLIDTLKINNCWITTLDEVVDFRNKLKVLSVGAFETENETEFQITLPGDTVIKGLTFKFDAKPEKITFSGSYDLKEKNGQYYLIADVRNNDIIRLNY